MTTRYTTPRTSTQRVLAEIEAHLGMMRVISRENELLTAARDELLQLDWALRLVMEADARDHGPQSAAENNVSSDTQIPPELRDGRIVDTPHPDALPDGSLSKSTAKRIEALAKLPSLPAGAGACELYAHLLDMLGAKDHEHAARIIAQHHARELGDSARVTDGVALIAAERRRQIEAEGWTPQHDDEHERVVAELREKFDEQVQITARIANENASNRLRAERAEARVAELEAENVRLRDEAASALALLARMRAACGDDGRRMQDELEAYLRELRADAERLDFLDQCREGTLRLDGPRLIPAYQRWGGTATHKDARAAIDAARQQENA